MCNYPLVPQCDARIEGASIVCVPPLGEASRHALKRENLDKKPSTCFWPAWQLIALLSELYLETCLFSSVRNRRDIRPLDSVEQWTRTGGFWIFSKFCRLTYAMKWCTMVEGLLVGHKCWRFGDKATRGPLECTIDGFLWTRIFSPWLLLDRFGRRGCNKCGFLFPRLEFWLSFSSFVERRLFCGQTENRELNSYPVLFFNN